MCYIYTYIYIYIGKELINAELALMFNEIFKNENIPHRYTDIIECIDIAENHRI